MELQILFNCENFRREIKAILFWMQRLQVLFLQIKDVMLKRPGYYQIDLISNEN